MESVGMTTAKSLDIKLGRILSDSSVDDFILADAKDADMGFGIAAPGPADGEHSASPHRTLE